jgi:hypothetical protein
MQISIYYFRANGHLKDAVKMWVYCPDGVYRLDCVLKNGVPCSKAELRARDSKYRLSIEGIGSFREPKTLKEVNVILARHGLWPFRETSERCPEHSKCLAKMDPERNLITV